MLHRFETRRPSLLAVALLSLLSLAVGRGAVASVSGGLEFLGRVTLPDQAVAGVPVGGLSGLVYEEASGLFWAISDDRAERGPARVVRLRIALEDGKLTDGDITVVDAVALRRADGSAFPPGSLDPEGIAIRPTASSSRRRARPRRAWIHSSPSSGATAACAAKLPLPERYRVDPAGVPGRGVRDNLGFEALALSPDGATLWAAVEGALQQEGPVSDVGVGSRARLLALALRPGRAISAPEELLMPVDAVLRPPLLSTAFRVNGFSELLAGRRSACGFSNASSRPGPGHRVRLHGRSPPRLRGAGRSACSSTSTS